MSTASRRVLSRVHVLCFLYPCPLAFFLPTKKVHQESKLVVTTRRVVASSRLRKHFFCLALGMHSRERLLLSIPCACPVCYYVLYCGPRKDSKPTPMLQTALASATHLRQLFPSFSGSQFSTPSMHHEKRLIAVDLPSVLVGVL